MTTADPVEYDLDIEGHNARILALLPEVLHPILQKPKQEAFTEQYEGALLFVDVAGFSAVANQLQKLQNEAEGAESLSLHLNSYFTRLIQVVKRHHGDIIFFSGDAMMVAWNRGSLQETCAACYRTGAALLAETPEYSFTLSDETSGVPITCTMKLHIGASGGTYYGLIVGGRGSMHLGRWKYLLGGAPVKASGILAAAGEHGELVVDDTIVAEAEKMNLFAETTPVSTIEGGVTYTGHLFVKFKDTVEFPDLSALIPPPFELTPATKAIAKQYVFDTVLKATEEPGLGGELRTVFTVFIKLTSLNPNLPPFELHAKVNQAVETIQKVLVEYDGIMNKVMMDDKGIICLCLFGVPLHGHENDALRSMQFAVHTAKNLNRVNQVVASIGISKAAVFCGLTGSPVRNEYTCLGDGVNLAARLMIKAENFDDKHPQIIVDPLLTVSKEVSTSLASLGMAFVEGDLMHLKGQAEPIRCYHLVREKDRDIVMEKLLSDDSPAGLTGESLFGNGDAADQKAGREDQKVKVRSAGASLLTHPKVILRKQRSKEKVAVALANVLPQTASSGGGGGGGLGSSQRKSIAAGGGIPGLQNQRQQLKTASSKSVSRESSTGSLDKRLAGIGKHWVGVLRPSVTESRDVADYVSPRDALRAMQAVPGSWGSVHQGQQEAAGDTGSPSNHGRGKRGKPKQRVNVRGFGGGRPGGKGRSVSPKARPLGLGSSRLGRGGLSDADITDHLLDDLTDAAADPLEASRMSDSGSIGAFAGGSVGGASRPKLVGRGDELELCTRAVDRWVGAAPPLLPTPGLPQPQTIRNVIISGEALSGKSYFLSLVEDHVEKNASVAVLRCRCGQSEKGLQYAAVRPLLKKVFTETDISVLDADMPAHDVEVFPLLGHVARIQGLGPLTDELRGMPTATKVNRINACMLAILKKHHGTKLIFSIDDMQWLDDHSASFIMDAMADASVFIVGCLREELLKDLVRDEEEDDAGAEEAGDDSDCSAESDEPMSHHLKRDGTGHARLQKAFARDRKRGTELTPKATQGGRKRRASALFSQDEMYYIDLMKLVDVELTQELITAHNLDVIQSVDAELLRRVHDQCDGIPGLMLRAVRKLKSSGILKTDLNGKLYPAVEADVEEALRELVPSTFEANVMSVVDRLSKRERLTATMAAVLGRAFSLDLLVDAMDAEGINREQTRQAVVSLTATGMLVVDRKRMTDAFAHSRSHCTDPLTTGNFRVYFLRATVRQVLYNSLLNRERDRLHAHAAVVIDANTERGEQYLQQPKRHQAHHYMAAGDLKHGWSVVADQASELKGSGQLLEAFQMCAALAAFADKVRGSQWGLDNHGALEEGSGRPPDDAMKAWSLDVSLVCYEAGFLWASDVHASVESKGVFKSGWDPLMLEDDDDVFAVSAVRQNSMASSGANVVTIGANDPDGTDAGVDNRVGDTTTRGGADATNEGKDGEAASKKKKKKNSNNNGAAGNGQKKEKKKRNPFLCCCAPPPEEEEDANEVRDWDGSDDDEMTQQEKQRQKQQQQQQGRTKKSKVSSDDLSGKGKASPGSPRGGGMVRRVSKLTSDRSSIYRSPLDSVSMDADSADDDTPGAGFKYAADDVASPTADPAWTEGAPAETQFAVVKLEIALFMCKPYLQGLFEDARHTLEKKQRRILEPIEHCLAVLRGAELLRDTENDDADCGIGMRYHLEHKSALLSPFTIMAELTGDRWRGLIDLPGPPVVGVGAPCSLVPIGTRAQEMMYPKVPRPSLLMIFLACRAICAMFVGEREVAVRDIESLVSLGATDIRTMYYGVILQSYFGLWYPDAKFENTAMTEAEIAATIHTEAGFAGDLLLTLLWITRVDPCKGEEMLCEAGCAITPFHLLMIAFLLDDHKSLRPLVLNSGVNRVSRLVAALDKATQIYTFARPAYHYYTGLLIGNSSTAWLRSVELSLDPILRKINPFSLRAALRVVHMKPYTTDIPKYITMFTKKYALEAVVDAASPRTKAGLTAPMPHMPKADIRDELKALGESAKMTLLPEVRQKWEDATDVGVDDVENEKSM